MSDWRRDARREYRQFGSALTKIALVFAAVVIIAMVSIGGIAYVASSTASVSSTVAEKLTEVPAGTFASAIMENVTCVASVSTCTAEEKDSAREFLRQTSGSWSWGVNGVSQRVDTATVTDAQLAAIADALTLNGKAGTGSTMPFTSTSTVAEGATITESADVTLQDGSGDVSYTLVFVYQTAGPQLVSVEVTDA